MSEASFARTAAEVQFTRLRERHEARGPAIRWRIRLRRALVLGLILPEFVVQIGMAAFEAAKITAGAVKDGWTEAPRHLLERDAAELRGRLPAARSTPPEGGSSDEGAGDA